MKLSAWIKEPTRVIHIAVSVAAVVAAVALDLGNAINGQQTWIGVGIAVANVVQGEINRNRVSPATSTLPTGDTRA